MNCDKCLIDKDTTEFTRCKKGSDKRRSTCKVCTNSIDREYRKTTSGKNAKRKAHLAYMEKIDAKVNYKKYQASYARSEKGKIADKKWKNNNKHLSAAQKAKRRAAKKQATPVWTTAEHFKKIEILYEKAKWLESITGLEYEVDHIVPLQHSLVCGLHVWDNLQILEKSLNCIKNNKFSLTDHKEFFE